MDTTEKLKPLPQLTSPDETAAEAIYPAKEAWKNEPGNRYTAKDLREMERNWNFELIDSFTAESHRLD